MSWAQAKKKRTNLTLVKKVISTANQQGDMALNGELNNPTDELDFKVQGLQAFKPNANPYHTDLYHMGVSVNVGEQNAWTVLYDGSMEYLIVVHRATGKRIKIDAPKRVAIPSNVADISPKINYGGLLPLTTLRTKATPVDKL